MSQFLKQMSIFILLILIFSFCYFSTSS